MNKAKQEIKVLHLTRWYPNKYDNMLGLFVKRHFEATAIYHKCFLVYACPVNKQKEKYVLTAGSISNGTELIVYYRDFNLNVPLIKPLIKAFRYTNAINKGIRYLKSNGESFDFIHIHILTRLGLWGIKYKLSKNIPYGITEHWSRYLPETGNFKGFFRKFFTKRIIARASFVSTVTENLHKAMLSHGLKNNNYFVLPNVVSNEFLKDYEIDKTDKKTFVHVSAFEDKSKNISGIIRVISRLAKEREDFVFKLIGNGEDFERMQKLSSELIKNKDVIKFTGILEGELLAKEIATAEAMVVFSNYENFPVVINEALTMGVPVIATTVGGIPEIINTTNGVLINAGDEDALYRSLVKFLNNKTNFDRNKIKKEFRNKYTPETIGKILSKKYLSAINHSHPIV